MDSRGRRPELGSIATDGTVSTGGLGTDATGIADLSELMPGMMVGEYQIEGQLGAGGMGRVYSAIHPVIAKRAAVKVLHPELSVNKEAVERFIQEARSVNQIGHPNIVDIFAFGTLPDGRNYFVMEWLRGESLHARLKREPLSIVDALATLETITLPLEAAHEKGIVHRDLKPDNVFLVDVKGDRPQIKLLDFGIAKLTNADGVRRTQTGNMLGTPAYISPEQARAQNVDHRTDIYALGAVLFELLTGDLVFEASNAADMIAMHLFQPPRSASALNPNVPPQLDALITAMLAKEAAARPTLEQIRSELRACRVLVGGALTPPLGTTMPHQTPGMYTPPPGSYTPAPGSLTPPHPYTPPHGIHAQSAPTMPNAASPLATMATATRPRSRAPVFVLVSLAALALGAGVFFAMTRKSEPPSNTAAPAATPSEPPVEATPTPVEVKPAEPTAAEPAPVESTPAVESKPVVVEAKPAVEATKPESKRTKPRTIKPATTTKPTTTKPSTTEPKKGSGAKYDPDAPM